MAKAVGLRSARAEPLIVEAGTGTGKTFAYLVPALLSGRSVIISTGTRTLQDQLFRRDVPLLARALGHAGARWRCSRDAPITCAGTGWTRHPAGSLFAGERGAGRRSRASRAGRRTTKSRRSRGTHRPARAVAGLAEHHLDARELPRPGVPAVLPLPCDRGAPRRAGGRHRGGQSPSAARRPRAQGRGLRRSAARGRGGHPGRGASGAGHRGAVLRTDLVGAAGADSAARRGARNCSAAGVRAPAIAARIGGPRIAARGSARGAAAASARRAHEWAQLPDVVPGCAARARGRARRASPPQLEGLGAGAGTASCARRARGARATALARFRALSDEAGLALGRATPGGLSLQFTPFEIAERLRGLRRGAPLRLGVHLGDARHRR